jgi:predicted transcriptional regulator
MTAISLMLPDDLDAKLDAEAKLSDRPRSELLRDALAEYLARRERERFMAEVVRAAKALAEDPAARREALEVAEEFLPLDNEALDIAEGRKPGESPPEESGSGGQDERWWR